MDNSNNGFEEYKIFILNELEGLHADYHDTRVKIDKFIECCEKRFDTIENNQSKMGGIAMGISLAVSGFVSVFVLAVNWIIGRG